MTCKNCDEGMVVDKVHYEQKEDGQANCYIVWKICPCCGGEYASCPNCDEG